MSGKEMSVGEVMLEIEKDRSFYETSDGGVTFSGGEPFLQPEFLKLLLAECKRKGLHNAVDTAGNVPWENIEATIKHVNLFLYDIKLIDGKKHELVTGQDNKRILDNFKKLTYMGVNMIVRVPVIPTVNDTISEMCEIADTIKKMNSESRIELLPFHKIGRPKYDSLGLTYAAAELDVISDDKMNEFRQLFIDRQLKVV
jgi:pyruvate formate lyase activating enzyme